MYGKGILKGLSVTAKRFWNTYWEDTVWFFRRFTGGKKRYYTPEGIARRSSKDARGIFTIQYPEEKLPTPEEFRYVPFLVYDETEDGEKGCTLHILWNLLEGLPAAVYLDRAHERSQDRQARPSAG